MENHGVSKRLQNLEAQVSELLLHRAAVDVNALEALKRGLISLGAHLEEDWEIHRQL